MAPIAKLGREVDSRRHWEDIAQTYVREVATEDYHAHRLAVIRDLIPKEMFAPGRQVFDFGCGDAVLFQPFLAADAHIEGADISERMIAQACERLAKSDYDSNLVHVADVNYLKELGSSSLDGLLSFNVLAYLTDGEDRLFYEEASRILKPGGHLVVTHSNELFDMFSLNRYTLEFFRQHLVTDAAFHAQLDELLSASQVPHSPTGFNIRENPLTYRLKLAKHGFLETRQEFINLHGAPPPLLAGKTYPNTLRWPEDDRWKLMFVCSTFGSCAVRQ